MSEDNNNKSSDNEICPYCQKEIEFKFFEDHMVAHEIEIDEKKNNNNSNNSDSNNNSNISSNNNNRRNNNNSDNSINNLENLFSNVLGNIFNPNSQSNNNNSSSNINNIGQGLFSFLGLRQNNNNNNNNNSSNNNSSNNNNNNSNENTSPLQNIFSTISKAVSGINQITSQLNYVPLSNIGNNNSEGSLPPIPQNNPASTFFSRVQVLPPIIIGGPGGILNPLQNQVNIDAIMNLLPSSVVTEEKEGDNNCIICLNDMKIGDNVTSLPCLHVFHTDCIKQWLQSKNSCPICKYEITEQSLRGGN